MRRSELLLRIRHHGCVLRREGRSHSLWMNPRTGSLSAVPKRPDLPDALALRIKRALSITDIGG